MDQVGLAFSGGGVRSAALCSGVLRRLLQHDVKLDCLSCVSGGGYTGTAYLDWKYRNEQKDDPSWHQQFFDQMRQRVGVVCNWQTPLQGFFDTVILLTLLFVVSIILPIVTLFSFAFPTAYLVDFLFGPFMRAPFICPEVASHNFTAAQVAKNPTISKLYNMTSDIECVPILDPQMLSTFVVFVSLFIAFLLLYFLKATVGPTLSPFVRFLFNITGFLFAMVFLPWLIEEYIVVTPMWLNALVIILSIFLWLGIPPLRDKASLALIVYLYAYAVKWRVYKTSVLHFEYTDVKFYIVMWISAILIWLNPLFGLVQINAIHAYNSWRLQKSFYSPESTAVISCAGLCQDILSKCTCAQPVAEDINKPLTLADLQDVAPEYICNVAVNKWRRPSSRRERNYELLTMSPSGIERLDNELGINQFEGLIHPKDIKLSTAMATSAAALSFHMGKHESKIEPLRSLQIMLGLGMGKAIVVAPNSWTGITSRAVAFLIQVILVFPIFILSTILWLGGSEAWNQRAVILFLALLALLTAIAIMPTGGENPGFWQNVVRWCIANIYHVRFIREALDVTHVGSSPPPVLYLSDGGHIENLGVLPLLKRRLGKIVVVDGGFQDDREVASSLLMAVEQAREKLYCSFFGMNGGDFHEDFRRNFVDKPTKKQPRSYRFKVGYYQADDAKGASKEEGEVLYILPRHPRQGLSSEEHMYNWGQPSDEVKIEMEPLSWGASPVIEPEEAEGLTWCCCECCHTSFIRCLAESCCGAFPNHLTANQFFTPAMFSAYHREGYRACAEARVVEFLGGMEKIVNK